MTGVKTTKTKSYSAQTKTANIVIHVFLFILSIIWVLPILWLIITSLRGESTGFVSYIFPKEWSFDNYIKLFTMETEAFKYLKWFGNTLLVAVLSCIISTTFVLMVSYVLSRMRFKSRKKFLNLGLILGMFPGFMSMAATYAIVNMIGLQQNLMGLVLVYSAGSVLGYQIAKGFFDTISRSLDEAAKIDGASRARIFFKIILPLSKPIVVYTALTTFISPWTDYIFVSYFMKSNVDNYTIAYGLKSIIMPETVTDYFTIFCAGSVLIAIPITILFIFMQKYYVEGVTGGAVKG
ncbi:MAG: sugar ABC transporter permease [Acutalibacteraceae bacterium]